MANEQVQWVKKHLLDEVYRERNHCVAALAKMATEAGHHAYIMRDTDTVEPEWQNVIVIRLPTGQVSWHVHESEMMNFIHLPIQDHNDWDGHDTSEKYRRIRLYTRED